MPDKAWRTLNVKAPGTHGMGSVEATLNIRQQARVNAKRTLLPDEDTFALGCRRWTARQPIPVYVPHGVATLPI